MQVPDKLAGDGFGSGPASRTSRTKTGDRRLATPNTPPAKSEPQRGKYGITGGQTAWAAILHSIRQAEGARGGRGAAQGAHRPFVRMVEAENLAAVARLRGLVRLVL